MGGEVRSIEKLVIRHRISVHATRSEENSKQHVPTYACVAEQLTAAYHAITINAHCCSLSLTRSK